MPDKRYRLALIAFAVLSVGAIGLSQLMPTATEVSTIKGAAPLNACSFLAAEDIEPVIGIQVDTGVRHDAGYVDQEAAPGESAYSSTCLWRISSDRDANDPSAPLGGARFVILNMMSWPDDVSASGFLQSFHQAVASGVISVSPVPLEIGDESLWWGDGVAVRLSNVSFGISVHILSPKDEERNYEERLASRIAANF